MTKPLLHEQLRELTGRSCQELAGLAGVSCTAFCTKDACHKDIYNTLADRIENEYLPLPCDSEGKQWKIGDPVYYPTDCNGEVHGEVYGYKFNGRWYLLIKSVRGFHIEEFAVDCSRPTAPVLDADGVEIKSEDTMFGTGREQHCYTVQKPYNINKEVGKRFCVQCYDHNEGNVVWCDPSMLTHQEPDSLEKLRDAMAKAYEFSGARILGRYVERLTALIERGV